MTYTFSASEPASGFLDIRIVTERSPGELLLQLPCWRPGRYEIGNFAKNVTNFSAVDENNQMLAWDKTGSHRWKVNTGNAKQVTVRYRYFAGTIDGGSCYVSPTMLYVNPVQCCMYDVNDPGAPCLVRIEVDEGWKQAVPMNSTVAGHYECDDFDALADSPFLCSPGLMHHSYSVGDRLFHIWIEGKVDPDWPRIEKDFKAFTGRQIDTLGDFPVSAYHFLVHVLPFRFFHGVEHLRSTVLVVGPDTGFMNELYTEFVGVASHELFHVWNVKAIRPVEMQPYDFTGANYSRLGYVYEGFTTYYGDLFLARSGFYDVGQYLGCINKRLQRHLHNPGHLNYSVAQSSYDTWLDGYVPGAPGRKTSIYDEGSLVALMADLLIRRESQGRHSLDDVMRWMYEFFGKTATGYTEKDLERLIGKAAGCPAGWFLARVVYGTGSYEPVLRELLEPAGLYLAKIPADKIHESVLGFRVDSAHVVKVVWPGSPAANAGLMHADEILSVNGVEVAELGEELCTRSAMPVRMSVKRMGSLVELQAAPGGKSYFDKISVSQLDETTEQQYRFLSAWLGR